MLSKKHIEIAFTLVLLLTSVVVIIESYKMSLGNLRDPGPGFLPFCAAVIMGILILIHLIKVRLTLTDTEPAFSSFGNLKYLFYTIIIAFTTALFFESLGFIVMTAFFLISILKFVGRENWFRILSITTIVLIFSYLIFIILLKIQLPMGPFNFLKV